MRWCAARAGGGCRSDGGCGGSFCKGSAEDVDGDAEEDDVEGVTPAAGAPGIFGGITSLMILAMGLPRPWPAAARRGGPASRPLLLLLPHRQPRPEAKPRSFTVLKGVYPSRPLTVPQLSCIQ
ncbi:hypothetical protein ACCO45_007392 [Purpureocillium lilacinum]|uniref:Uncharacterized protein n=1 Tax=Purpureocillium lilacinum TaxID=33203 RepID=A0ACC4DS83_PURLI